MTELELKNVSKAYGEHVVLRGFSHVFEAGRVTAILGPSGCGKTTLLRLIAGLETPDSGDILGAAEGGLSMVFQEDRLPLQLTGVDCLRCVLKKAPDRDERILSALRALGLGDSLAQPVREYSGGMRRRIALARALLFPAPLVLMDEPFKGLDDATRNLAINFSRSLLTGRTAMLVTHDPHDVAGLDDAILRLEDSAR